MDRDIDRDASPLRGAERKHILEASVGSISYLRPSLERLTKEPT